LAELGKIAGEPGGCADLGIELFVGQEAGFETIEEGRLAEERSEVFEAHLSATGNPTGGNGVIKIDEDFAQIENDNFWEGHDQESRDEGVISIRAVLPGHG